jgi:hypothetical protein
MKFSRHLAAVMLLVAVITVLGLAWNHWAPATLIGNPFDGRQLPGLHLSGPPPGHLLPGQRPGHPVVIQRRSAGNGPKAIDLNGKRARFISNQGGAGAFSGLLEFGGLRILRHTVVIETALIAAVVIIDLARRRARRANRRAALSASE